jgi:hypothetical protein
MLAHVIGRVALFLARTAVGAVGFYGLPYALTPYGLLILRAALFAGSALVAYTVAGRALCARR